MKADVSCADVRPELSARLDGELDAATAAAIDSHLDRCPECRARARRIERVRRALRAQPAEAVPDLSGRILERLQHAPPRASPWRERVRVAAIAAAAAALVVVGASLPFVRRPPQSANADEIARGVRAAARALDNYRARFEIVERGWHPRVPVRRFEATLAFDAPERFRLRVRDDTSYPSGHTWPRNTVDIVASAGRWWIREPATCPIAALPQCAGSAGHEARAIVGRQPFDGTSILPTDIIVPLETLTTATGFEVLGDGSALGRPTHRVAVAYRQASPLVRALQAGGSWRALSPFDRVEIWVDKRTWFPLRFTVTSAASARPIMTVRATAFSEPRAVPRALFAAPAPAELVAKDGDFAPEPARRPVDFAPRFVAGLEPYRSGTTGGGRSIRSYAEGIAWLKVVHDPHEVAQPPYAYTAEEVALGDGGFVYYEPAASAPGSGSSARSVDIYTTGAHVHLESNLSRAELLRVAASIPLAKHRIPARRTEGGLRIERLSARAARLIPFVRWPSYLPPGYRASAAFRSRSRDGRETVTVYFRRAERNYDGLGIRVTQAVPVRLLPPTSETFHSVDVRGAEGRFSIERAELEWREGATYRAVQAPSFGVGTTLRIARSLR